MRGNHLILHITLTSDDFVPPAPSDNLMNLMISCKSKKSEAVARKSLRTTPGKVVSVKIYPEMERSVVVAQMRTLQG